MEATAPVLLLEQIHTEHGQQASVASQSENSSVRVPVDALATAQASRTSTSSPSTSPLVSSVCVTSLLSCNLHLICVQSTSGLAAPSQSGQCLDPLSRKQPNIAELLRQAGRSEDVILDLTSAGAHVQCDEATPLRSRWLGFNVQGAYAPVHVQRSATQHFGIVNAAEGTSYIAGDLLRLKYNKLEYGGHLIAIEQLSGHYWLHVLIGDTVWRFPFSRNAPAREGRVTYTELHRLLSSVKKHERSTPPDTEKRYIFCIQVQH